MQIKIAQSNHIAGILDIYAPFIENTHASFEYQIPSLQDMQSRVEMNLRFYPWIVAESKDGVVGYAYGTRFRYRKAYDWVCETSVYIHPDAKRKGVATQLYLTLLHILKAQGIKQCIAGVALPNEESILFHEKHGFKYVGVFPKVGFKQKRWVDVAFWQLELSNEIECNSPVPWHLLPKAILQDCGINYQKIY